MKYVPFPGQNVQEVRASVLPLPLLRWPPIAPKAEPDSAAFLSGYMNSGLLPLPPSWTKACSVFEYRKNQLMSKTLTFGT